jgi:hypothetical protein
MTGLASPSANRKSIPFYLAFLLLLITFALLVFSVAMKSPTMDEQNHVARGLAYLRTGDLRLSQEHPPGVNAWEAWPLLLDPQIRLPLDSPSWANAEWYGFADQLLWRVNDRPQEMVFASRVPVMWLTLLLAALVCRWARELGGGGAGLIALALFSFDPNILAHGRLATTDLGVTCLAFAAMFVLWRAMRSAGRLASPVSDWGRWALSGIVLGIAQAAKFSALALGPVIAVIAVCAWIAQSVRQRSLRGTWRWMARLLLLFGAGFGVLWAVYGFQWGSIALFGGLPGPAPAYWAGIQAILRRTGGGTPSFLMGQYAQEGWWYYFPVSFAIKTPLPTLILLMVAIGKWASHPTTQPPNSLLCLLLPVLAFWAMALVGSFNIGYRHILPSLPFLYVLAGRQMGKWANYKLQIANRKSQIANDRHTCGSRFAICCLLILWLAVGTVSVAPHYLAFFNVIAGGPDGGYRFLVDSNLDWGQDLPGLKRYVQENDIERVYLSWFGAAHPEAYGFPFHPLPGFWRFGGEPAAYGFNPFAPAPGVYAISASNLQGVRFADRDLYAWFRRQTPVARIGHSIFVYQVEEQGTNDQAVVIGVPMAQLADEERALLQRVSSIRQYDPGTGFIVPLAAETLWFIAPQPPGRGRIVREGPGYVVVHDPGWMLHPQEPVTRCGPFVRMFTCQIEDTSLDQDGTVTVHVQWEVERAPHRAAVSFAHLLDDKGRYVAGWDGLTAPATCWQQGDLIQQVYTISLPTDLAPGTYQVEVGWYDADTLQRWPCSVDGERVGDRLLLPEVEMGK